MECKDASNIESQMGKQWGGSYRIYGRKQSRNATVHRAQSLDTLTQLGNGHNYHHATCINSRQLTSGSRAGHFRASLSQTSGQIFTGCAQTQLAGMETIS